GESVRPWRGGGRAGGGPPAASAPASGYPSTVARPAPGLAPPPLGPPPLSTLPGLPLRAARLATTVSGGYFPARAPGTLRRHDPALLRGSSSPAPGRPSGRAGRRRCPPGP